jgi:hypothetical protein
LGVVWYLTPDDLGGADGKHTSYLDRSAKNERTYRSCDPDLYDRLRAIVHRGRRAVASIERGHVLPPDTLFYSDRVPHRRQDRPQWAGQACSAMTGVDVVLVDPDNGLERQSPTDQHALFQELAPLCDGRRSIVIYQQQARMFGGHSVELPWHLARVRDRLPNAADAFAVRFARGTSRAFIVIPGRDHSVAMERRVQRLVDGSWGQRKHFDQVIYR